MPPVPEGSLLYVREFNSSEKERIDTVEFAMDALLQKGIISADDDYFVRLCLDEALTNAVCHGNRSNPALKVVLRVYQYDGRLVFVVQDQGKGFDPAALFTRADDMNEGESGRGLVIIDGCMDEFIVFNGGTGCMMVKYL